jgi:hypothetical protein
MPSGTMSFDPDVKPVGILYEHPQWFVPLFEELERREIPYERIHAASSHSTPPTANSATRSSSTA